MTRLCIYHAGPIWVNLFFNLLTLSGIQLTFRSGFADDVRAQFASNHSLDNTKDTNFRAVNDAW